MALDWRTEVKASIRQRCWIEWVQHYTYGQTRDRVIHAKRRIQQLGRSDFQIAPTWRGLAPPAAKNRSDAAGGGSCMGKCRSAHDSCSRSCSINSCVESCRAVFSGCVGSCG